jgi:hypothetical protein
MLFALIQRQKQDRLVESLLKNGSDQAELLNQGR